MPAPQPPREESPPLQRRPLLTALLSLATLALPVQPALAQDAWPSKPVKLIDPLPAGGTSDVMACVVAEALSKALGQQVIVENTGGAGGTLGTLRATKAAPDGYTLIQTGVGQNGVAHGLDPKLGDDSLKDFVHISQEPVGLGASIARSGTSEDSFCRICRPIAQLWDKKPVKNGPLRPLRSRRSPSPTGS